MTQVQEWGFMVPVEGSVAYESRMQTIVMEMAQSSLKAAHPKASILSGSVEVAVPLYPTDTCPEGWVMCGVLLTFREDA